LDPVAANRIHPNDNRKINQYLSLYARSGLLPSKLLQGKAMENWVEQRVDCMVDAGLLSEVYTSINQMRTILEGYNRLSESGNLRIFLEFSFLKVRIAKKMI
ncbi:tRNA dimethylallyltransferase, partial [Sarracenia purpurea var. burkii]